MTFIAQKQSKSCFIQCDEEKIRTGQCSCINNIFNTINSCNNCKSSEYLFDISETEQGCTKCNKTQKNKQL